MGSPPLSPSALPDRSDVLEVLGRVGYAVKGAVYALLGLVALDAALTPSSPEGSAGLFRWLSGGVFGDLVVGVLAVGLGAYSLWRLALAVLPPQTEDAGAGKRAYFVASGGVYGFLCYQATKLLLSDSTGDTFGGADPGRGPNGAEVRTGALLSLPYGRIIVGALAAVLLGYAARQFYRAYATPFTERLDLHKLTPTARTWTVRLARAGMAARGVVYVVAAGFLAASAWRASSEASGGLGEVLVTLKAQPFGPYLLGAVAVGLVGYGVYCGLSARYRRYG